MKPVRSVSGMTLAEVLLATALASFAMVGILTSFISLQRSFTAAQEDMVEVNRFIQVQSRLALDLRNVVAITQMSPSRLELRVRYYDDADTADRQVEYQVDGAAGTLVRMENGQSQVLMRRLVDGSFEYFRRSPNGAEVPAISAAEVNAVRISLVPDHHSPGGGIDRRAAVFTSSLFQLRRVVLP